MTAPAIHWQLRERTLSLGPLPRLMGIVNVTPDSFSDGGRFLDPARAVDHGLRLANEGADLLDVGGESTRPYSQTVGADEELRRTLQVVTRLARQTKIPISIDTSKALVARAAIDAGAEIINDVTGLLGDPAMLDVARETNCAVCVMHMQGTPQNMQDRPTYRDVLVEVRAFLRERRDTLATQGISWERIALDPGIGFGKTHQHNLDLLASAEQLHALQCPVLVGHSRKGFLNKVLADTHADLDNRTLGVALSLAARRIQILRVHEVKRLREALALFAATGGIPGHPFADVRPTPQRPSA